jgi:hypothetical protein
MVDDGRLTWLDWRNGGAELLLLRDLYPSVSEEVLGAGFRQLEACEDDPAGRDAVLVLLDGCEAGAKEGRD